MTAALRRRTVQWKPAFHARTPERVGNRARLTEANGRAALERLLRRSTVLGHVEGAFQQEGRPSRWTDGTFGIFYVARDAVTAMYEKLHHDALALRRMGVGPHRHAIELLTCTLHGRLHDVRALVAPDGPYAHPTDYAPCQTLGRALYVGGADGILYRSVRDVPAWCAAVFQPGCVSSISLHKGLTAEWTGRHFEIG